MSYRLALLLLFPLLLTGCCSDNDLKLSPRMPAWVPYETGQALAFRNAAGATITFRATRRTFNQTATDKVCGSYEIETIETELRALSDPGFRVQIRVSHEALVGLQVGQDQPAGNNINIRYNSISEQYISDPWRDKFYREIMLNGKTYHQVLVAFGHPISGSLAFSEIYYGKDTGLIGFRLFSGEAFFHQP